MHEHEAAGLEDSDGDITARDVGGSNRGFSGFQDPGHPVFKIKDRVYAKDGVGVYAADVIKAALKPLNKSKEKDSSPDGFSIPSEEKPVALVWKYRVHYLGWNKKWDKWVKGDALLPDDEHGRGLYHTFQQKEQERKDQERREADAKRLAKKRKKLQKFGEDDVTSVGSGGFLESVTSTPVAQQIADENSETVIDTSSMNCLLMTAESEVEGPEKKKTKTEGEPVLPQDLPQDVPSTAVEEPKPPLALPFTLKTILSDDREKISPPSSHKAFAQPTPAEWYATRFLPCIPTSSITVKQCIDTFLSRKITQYKQKLKRRKRDLGSKPPGIPNVIGDNNTSSDRNADHKKAGTSEAKISSEDSNEAKGDTDSSAKEELKTIDLWRNLMDDFLDLFDLALPPLLLYNQERAQYFIFKTKCEQKKMPFRHCELYSCVYLLRFLVRFPVVLEQVLPHMLLGDDEENNHSTSTPSIATEWKHTEALIDELIRYVQRHQSRLFPHNYRAPHDYELTPVERKCKEQAAILAAKSLPITGQKQPR
jgi:hypothetical protein